MRPAQIEAWALRVVEAIGKGAPSEDSQIELKAAWPDPKKAARQIAGHANASHGEPILWLIGVDEKKGVVGAKREELAAWWPQVESQFDGLAPRFSDLNIPVNDLTIVGLLMETDRAPFVVNNPAANMDKEVPWREGTRIRSARRADLMRLLEPLEKLPEIDFLWGYCHQDYFICCLFISPHADQSLIIPVHRCAGTIGRENGTEIVSLSEIRLLQRSDDNKEFEETIQVVIREPRYIGLRADIDPDRVVALCEENITFSIDLKPAGFQRAATLRQSLPWLKETKHWELAKIHWAKLDSYFFVPGP